MSTAREREQILNEYGAWVEGKTLGGIDTSVEAYLDEVETAEGAARAEEIYTMLTGGGASDAATFLARTRELFGIKEALDEQ